MGINPERSFTLLKRVRERSGFFNVK